MNHNIFISWSGPRSKWVAEALRDWLPNVLQSSKPWISSADIDKGTRSYLELSKPLEDLKVGISCLTPENLSAPWLLYEAGQLTKTIDPETRLYTYLLGGLKPKDIEPPLGWFQHTDSTRAETLVLIQSINKLISADPLSDDRVEAVFERFWPDLETKLKSMPGPEKAAKPSRSIEEMIAEILGILRSDMATRADIRAFVDRVDPVFAVNGVRTNFLSAGPRNLGLLTLRDVSGEPSTIRPASETLDNVLALRNIGAGSAAELASVVGGMKKSVDKTGDS